MQGRGSPLHERQRRGRAAPLLLVPGSVSAEIAGQIVALGAAGYLRKDHLDRLAPAVRDALARSPAGEP